MAARLDGVLKQLLSRADLLSRRIMLVSFYTVVFLFWRLSKVGVIRGKKQDKKGESKRQEEAY